jgi:threonine dehydrogenase-like Zn-dependent dehydrogenase
MKALMLEAGWEPKAGYVVSAFEQQTGKAVVGNSIYKGPKLSVQDIPAPKVGPKDVLLKIRACGVCGSDIHMLETDAENYVLYPGLMKLPVVTGHEFSGVVEEVGKEVTDLKRGDLVTAEEMIWCGECKPCRGGFVNQCVHLEEIGFTIPGAFAEYIAVGSKYCWKLDALAEKVGDAELALDLGATVEPSSVAYNAVFVRGGGFKPGAYAVVYGGGCIGLTAIGMIKAAGAAKLIAFETMPERRELAKAMGADYAFDPIALTRQGSRPSDVVLELTKGEGADFQLEAAGAPIHTFPEMERSLAINGKIAQVGRAADKVPIFLDQFQVRHAQIFGSQGHSGNDVFPNVIRMMASGALDNRKFVTARFGLDKVLDAIQQSGKRTDGKILVKPR